MQASGWLYYGQWPVLHTNGQCCTQKLPSHKSRRHTKVAVTQKPPFTQSRRSAKVAAEDDTPPSQLLPSHITISLVEDEEMPKYWSTNRK